MASTRSPCSFLRLACCSLYISGYREKEGKKKKIPTRDFASVESLHANAPPKPNTNAMVRRITPEPSVFIAEKEK